MVLFMDFGYILLHFSLCFGTYCIAFWCKMRCNNQQLGTIFLSFRMQILGNFSSKRNAKT